MRVGIPEALNREHDSASNYRGCLPDYARTAHDWVACSLGKLHTIRALFRQDNSSSV